MVLTGTVVLFCLLWVPMCMRGAPPNKFTKLVGISDSWIPFMDTYNITSGIDCSRLGYDVLVNDPCDVVNRPMNYPRAWLLAGRLGITRSSNLWCGIAIGLLFLSSVLLLARPSTVGHICIWLSVLFSWPVMFGLQRGNVDLIIFALMSLALYLRFKGGLWAPAILFGLSAVLKLFPVLAFPVLLLDRDPRRLKTNRVVLLSLYTAFACYALATAGDIVKIFSALPQYLSASYGAPVWAQSLHLITHVGYSTAVSMARIILVACVLTTFLIGYFRGRTLLRNSVSYGNLSAFAVGSLVFCSTFVAASNFAYRYCFLLFAIPLGQDFLDDTGKRRQVGQLLCASIIICMWTVRLSGKVAYLDQTIDVFLVCILSLITGALVRFVAKGNQTQLA